jgi:hypothetical protein
VNEEEHAQRYDTRQLMQLSQKESVAEFDSHYSQFRVRDGSRRSRQAFSLTKESSELDF